MENNTCHRIKFF